MTETINVTLVTTDNIHYLTSSSTKWTKVMTEMWNSFLNENERPVKRNHGNQFPMCKIYKNDIVLEKYLGIQDFCGEKEIGQIIFGDIENIKESLVWTSINLNVNVLLPLLNKQLLSLGYALKLEI